MKKIKNKRKLFLAVYGIIVLGILLFILLAPSSFFLSKKSKELLSVTERKYPEISVLFSKLQEKNYEYTYNLLDSMKSESIIYKCKGQVVNGSEIGTCTSPQYLEYSKDNKNSIFENLQFDLLDFGNIYDVIKEKEFLEKEYDGVRKVTYKDIDINSMKYDIVIYSDYSKMTELQIVNKYITYVIKLSYLTD